MFSFEKKKCIEYIVLASTNIYIMWISYLAYNLNFVDVGASPTVMVGTQFGFEGY